MKSKKADGSMFWIIATAALILLFVFVYFTAWKGLFSKGAQSVDGTIGNIEDSDGDGVINIQDKCSNTEPKASVDFKGCSAKQT